MKVTVLNDDRQDEYMRFLSNQDCSMIYYSLKFRSFLEKQTNSYSKYLLAIDTFNEIKGVLPLLFKDGPLGTVVNSLPFYGSNGGVLSENKEAEDVLLKEYINLLSGADILSGTLIENPFHKKELYKTLQCDELDSRIGQFTDISGNYQNLESLMIKFDSKTRNIIRKAIKSNVEVEVDNNKFDFLEATHIDNMKEIGGLAKNSSFFKNIINTLEPSKDYNLYIAKKDGVPIAATLVLYFGQIVEYYTPVIIKEYRTYQPLSLIISMAMYDANKKGYNWWNWGGTWESQRGVYEFKSKWGTIDMDYKYYITIMNKKVYDSSKNELLKYYSGFYVLPFSALNDER